MITKLLNIVLALVAMVAASPVWAQPRNLLQNPDADLKTQFWRISGEATIEMSANTNPCFLVRNGGYFIQDVSLPKDAVGKYAAFIGRGSSERIDAGGAITGLPYLYGYMMPEVSPRGGRVLEYLQGQNMRASPKHENEWVTMSGIFRVPEGTGAIRFFLNQALQNRVPHNGSAARFDDLGLYLFPTEKEAQEFVNTFN